MCAEFQAVSLLTSLAGEQRLQGSAALLTGGVAPLCIRSSRQSSRRSARWSGLDQRREQETEERDGVTRSLLH